MYETNKKDISKHIYVQIDKSNEQITTIAHHEYFIFHVIESLSIQPKFTCSSTSSFSSSSSVSPITGSCWFVFWVFFFNSKLVIIVFYRNKCDFDSNLYVVVCFWLRYWSINDYLRVNEREYKNVFSWCETECANWNVKISLKEFLISIETNENELTFWILFLFFFSVFIF